MNNENMKKALAKVSADVGALMVEREDEIMRDMADSFIAQSEDDPDKKLTYTFSVSAKITPTCDGAAVKTKLSWKVAKKATAESEVGE